MSTSSVGHGSRIVHSHALHMPVSVLNVQKIFNGRIFDHFYPTLRRADLRESGGFGVFGSQKTNLAAAHSEIFRAAPNPWTKSTPPRHGPGWFCALPQSVHTRNRLVIQRTATGDLKHDQSNWRSNNIKQILSMMVIVLHVLIFKIHVESHMIHWSLSNTNTVLIVQISMSIWFNILINTNIKSWSVDHYYITTIIMILIHWMLFMHY